MNLLNYGVIGAQRSGNVTPIRDITSAIPPSPQTFNYNTSFATVQAALPTQVTCTLDDGTLVTLAVTWLQGVYSPISAGTVTIYGNLTLLPNITNATNIQASVMVTVSAQIVANWFVAASGGSDSNSGTSAGSPFATIAKAYSVATNGQAVRLIAGNHVTNSYLLPPRGVTTFGDGVDVTFVRGNTSLNHTFVPYNYAFDKYLFQMNDGSTGSGNNQVFKDFTVEGNSRGMHGAFIIQNRNDVSIQNVKITNFRFNAAWFLNADRINFQNLQTSGNSLVISGAAAMGAIMVGTTTDSRIEGCTIFEGDCYGIKSFGPAPTKPTHTRLTVKSNSVSVQSTSSSPASTNISFELHDCYKVGCEISYNTFTANVSLVLPANTTNPTGITAIDFHHNTCDMFIRAGGGNYCLELDEHDVLVHDNYFAGGANGTIINYNNGNADKYNWTIYNNVFYNPVSYYPTFCIRLQATGARNLNIYNNVFHIPTSSTTTVYIFGANGGRTNQNVNIKNNLFFDESLLDGTNNGQWGADKLIQLDAGGTFQNLAVTNNCFVGMSSAAVFGGTFSNNITPNNPQITGSGAKPTPYYIPTTGSPLIGAGVNVGLPYSGTAPNIGVYDAGGQATAKTVASVAAQTAVSVTQGVSFATLQTNNLPTTVQVTLNDATVITMGVTWAQGTYNSAANGTYNLTGALSLPVNVTNPGNISAAIAVTVTSNVFFLNDTFSSIDTTTTYSLQNGATAVSNGSDLTAGGGNGTNSVRILYNTWDSSINANNVELTLVVQPLVISTTSYGMGIGLQNTVSPDPNLGVYLNFNMTSNTGQGLARILSGNGSSDTSYTLQATSASQLSIMAGRTYTMKLRRTQSGVDLIWYASVTDNTTAQVVTAQWTEVSGTSLLYKNTTKPAIFVLGSDEQVNLLTIENLGAPSVGTILNDLFDRATLGTDYTATGLTATMINPGVDLSGSDGLLANQLSYNTWNSSLTNWTQTTEFQLRAFNSTSYGHSVGTQNTVSPNPNWNTRLWLRCNQGHADVGKVHIYSGDGGASMSSTTQKAISASAVSVALNKYYRCTFQRAISGSDAIYTATVIEITGFSGSTVGSSVTCNYTETGYAAKTQAYYSSTKPVIHQNGGTERVGLWKIQ